MTGFADRDPGPIHLQSFLACEDPQDWWSAHCIKPLVSHIAHSRDRKAVHDDQSIESGQQDRCALPYESLTKTTRDQADSAENQPASAPDHPAVLSLS